MSRNHSLLTLTTELSEDIYTSRTRRRCPSARVTITSRDGRREINTLRVDVEKPSFEIDDASQHAALANDVLGKVIDEAAWLTEIARVLRPGGTLIFTVPASGPLAWWDTRNIYRYVVDIVRRGDTPDATLPTGWSRHYSPDDVVALLLETGFAEIEIRRSGIGIAEGPQLAGLLAGNLLLRKRETERQLYPLRRAMETIDARIPTPAIGTMLNITARRAAVAPNNPADDNVAENRPVEEMGSE